MLGRRRIQVVVLGRHPEIVVPEPVVFEPLTRPVVGVGVTAAILGLVAGRRRPILSNVLRSRLPQPAPNSAGAGHTQLAGNRHLGNTRLGGGTSRLPGNLGLHSQTLPRHKQVHPDRAERGDHTGTHSVSHW